MNALQTLSVNGNPYSYYSLKSLSVDLAEFPYSIRVLLESVLRNIDGFSVTQQDVENLAAWKPDGQANIEIPFKPARVLLQDFTGVPAVVDLAAMRAAMRRIGGDPEKINPLIPVDLVVDHSIQTDFHGTADALLKNVDLEFQRNDERYALLHWAQQSLANFRVVPPSVGIIHQVNLEYLADVVHVGTTGPGSVLYPDSVVGTDSHTVMINGLGVLGWGVGGIEAEAVMLGQPYFMLAPQVVGVELIGAPKSNITATDIVLTLTEILRKEGVVGKFVEYFGPGVQKMPVADRAVIANMAPEYGATMGFFPVDDLTLQFLRETARNEEHVAVVEAYCKEQQLFVTQNAKTPRYTKILTFDLSTVEPCLAGPKRPQDRVPLNAMKPSFEKSLTAPVKERGFGLPRQPIPTDGDKPGDGAVVIASITSCTNTSNPSLMLAAGLLAQKAVERGLRVPKFVKTSLGPGSRVVEDYLVKADLLKPLETLGFHIVGFGCLTCIGNSGPLPDAVTEEILKHDLVAAAVLSGNRNFEGRINPLVKANYLASPPLVVAYALAGSVTKNLTTEPLGFGKDGKPVFLKEIWPTAEETAAAVRFAVDPKMYEIRGSEFGIRGSELGTATLFESRAPNPEPQFQWNEKSTYIQEPPFLVDMRMTTPDSLPPIYGARCLIALGDSVTTDHISPAGAIKTDSPAGKFLLDAGVVPSEFNSYGSRRGNDRIMTRGTFANIRIRNILVPETEGGVTKYFPTSETMSIYDAAMRYKETQTPLVVLAGTEYGTGSSRDWAAKGTALLGVKVVIASSFERIHRGNLVGMGVLPLELPSGVTWQALNLTGEEEFSFPEIGKDFVPGSEITVKAEREVSPNLFSETEFQVKVRIDTPIELQYYLNGGILQAVVRKLAKNRKE